MRATGYKSHGVTAAAALVNAVTTADGQHGDDTLRTILRDNNFFWREYTAADGEVLRGWATTLRSFFETPVLYEAVAMLNRLMIKIAIHPHLSDHDGRGVHMHYAPPSADLGDRFKATTLMHLSGLICEHGLTRIGVCAAPTCDRVYADTSRGGRRRFCSDTCANRTNVAAFRARRRLAESTGP